MSRAATRIGRIAAIALIASASVVASIGEADARRAGGMGFGSRGTRTFDAPAATRTAPAPAAPIERSMTPRPQSTNPAATQQPGFNQPRRGLFGGGFAGSMIGGLVAGGLLGMLIGHGFGGGFGFLGMILQIVLVMVLASMALRYFRNRKPAYGTPSDNNHYQAANSQPGFRIPSIGGGAGASAAAAGVTRKASDDIGIGQHDLNRFESLLTEIQGAYGREDFAALRRMTTPEAMSYLAEEIGENASQGLRNKVSDVKLLQGDISEAWREAGQDYATLAMRYSSIDAMVDRDSGKLVSGDDRRPSESTEIWTFVRRPGEDWKLSAIQGTDRRAA